MALPPAAARGAAAGQWPGPSHPTLQLTLGASAESWERVEIRLDPGRLERDEEQAGERVSRHLLLPERPSLVRQ
jgi:hypothetical protein